MDTRIADTLRPVSRCPSALPVETGMGDGRNGRNPGMKRSIIMTLLCGIASMGMDCQGAGPLLVCANQVDGSAFGFMLTVPGRFTCISAFPNPVSISNIGFQDDATGQQVSVQVNEAQTGDPGTGFEVEELGEIQNPAGLTFVRRKITFEALGLISYVGGATLPNGNLLFITASGDNDDPALFETLDAIIETVALTGM